MKEHTGDLLATETRVLFIHVGLPKTGTTFLQHEIFPKIKNVNFIRSCDFRMEIYPSKTNIISNEGLSGYTADGSRGQDTFIMADRLKAWFPNAKIIVGLRDKKSWLRSCYGQWVKEGGVYSYDYWFENVFDKTCPDFEKYIEYLKELFSDVYVYRFEDLKQDADNCVKGICSFIGCDVPVFENKKYNASWSDKQIRVACFLNRSFKSKTVRRIMWLSGSNRWLK